MSETVPPPRAAGVDAHYMEYPVNATPASAVLGLKIDASRGIGQNAEMSLASIADVLAAIARYARPLAAIELPLPESRGLTLAEAVLSDLDSPPFDKAMMDGFAVRAEDCQQPPATLRVVGEVLAGALPQRPVGTGEAIRINTGAAMPAGADAVVMVERTELSADGRQVIVNEKLAPGRHVAARGVDIRAGEVILEAGTRVGAAPIAALAAGGATAVRVYRRPRLAVLVTGDELVDPAVQPVGAQIRNSNGPCLLALAREAGCEVVDLGVVGDDKEELSRRIRQGLSADVLCVTGGMSMGQRDYVPEALTEAGVRLEVQKISIKPGKPTAFGVGPAGQLVFGLPGNPVSCYVCFVVLVRAALAALQGREAGLPPTIPAVLEGGLRPAGSRAEYIPAHLEGDAHGHWRVRPARWQGSGDPFGLGRSNGLIVREAGAPAAQAGSLVRVVPFV